MRLLKNFIQGEWVPSASTEFLPLVNPATEEQLGRLPAGSAGDVDAAVESALAAATSWAMLPMEERLGMLAGVAEVLANHADALAGIECDEMGRPVAVGRPYVDGAIDGLRHTVEEARKYDFIEEIGHNDNGRSLVVRHPVGVVALIVPWNFTVVTVLHALGPLLATGNTVVLKPSEKASLSMVRMLELIELPPGVLNMVLGDGRAGVALSRHPAIGLTHFTGSVTAGRAVAVANADQLRRSVLELGGKDPVLIDADVDPVATARAVATGSFLNTGQICTSMERIYVHRDIAPDFVDALADAAESYTYGNGRDPNVLMGPLVDERQRQVVVSHIDDAVALGATIRTGGRLPSGPGFFYPATVLTDVTDDMLIMREETFGPVAPVRVVDSFDEALTAARGTRFGLAATVYSNTARHVDAAQHLPAGIVWINQWQAAGPICAYEPAKHSGLSATGGTADFDSATRPARVVHATP